MRKNTIEKKCKIILNINSTLLVYYLIKLIHQDISKILNVGKSIKKHKMQMSNEYFSIL